jgi:hypothetical protein
VKPVIHTEVNLLNPEGARAAPPGGGNASSSTRLRIDIGRGAAAAPGGGIRAPKESLSCSATCRIRASARETRGCRGSSSTTRGSERLQPTSVLAAVKTVKDLDAESTLPLQDDGAVEVGPIKKLWTTMAGALGVRDGDW